MSEEIQEITIDGEIDEYGDIAANEYHLNDDVRAILLAGSRLTKTKRNAFITYLRHRLNSIEQADNLAPTTLKSLLGSKGLNLYKKALAEEAKSTVFLRTVFAKSCKRYPGEKWLQRLIIIIAGPSGCGKTHSANKVLTDTSKTMATGDGENNDVVFVDGATVRQTSQIRKLVIKVAHAKGYSGISDLQRHSKALEPVKNRVRDAALRDESKSLVIPETFSWWSLKKIGYNPMKWIQKVIVRGQFIVKFHRINIPAENKTSHQRAIEQMARQRSHARIIDKKQSIKLNSNAESESKSHNSNNFDRANKGSQSAKIWFANLMGRDKAKANVTEKPYEFVLIKKTTDRNYEITDTMQPDVRVAHLQVFQEWQELDSHYRLDFDTYLEQLANTTRGQESQLPTSRLIEISHLVLTMIINAIIKAYPALTIKVSRQFHRVAPLLSHTIWSPPLVLSNKTNKEPNQPDKDTKLRWR